MTTAQRALAVGILLFGAFTSAIITSGFSIARADEVQVTSGSEIVCEVFEYLTSRGFPIPAGLDAEGCEGSGGGGGGTPGNTQCSNFIDDDGDGKVDYFPGSVFGDPECESPSDDSEGPVVPAAACADGIDNDNDGLVDSTDPGCTDSADNDETNTTSGGGGGGGTGEGGGSGGNSGGAAPACEDSVDNDGDGLIDMNDPGCENAADQDETHATGGSSGGGGGGSSSTPAATTTPAVNSESEAAPAEEVIACDQYLTKFIKFGGTNDPEQVTRLQKVLKDFEGADVAEDGVYDRRTLAAVHAFQTKYAADILAPWGEKKSTGYVYLTTRKKVNEIYCKSQVAFPLTTDEMSTIEKVKGTLQSVAPSAPVKPSQPRAAKQPEVKIEEDAKSSPDTDTNANENDQVGAASEAVERPINRIWRPLSDFFGRIFGR